MIHIGFTGTQRGMTASQKKRYRQFLAEHNPEFVLHHGDCVGADADAHNIAYYETSGSIIIHPPEDDRKRAFCMGYTAIRVKKPYLERNQDIVDESAVLFATPKEHTPQLRSGTWATIRRAVTKGIEIYVIFPDGHHKHQHARPTT